MINKDDEIKQLINPNSGFRLYVKKFNDVDMLQVSTVKTFPIPQDPTTTTNEGLNKSIHHLNETMSDIKKENERIIQTQQTCIETLHQKNKTLTILVAFTLIIGIVASVFF